MNKIFAIMLLLAVSITAQAQTEKGRSSLGLGFGYSHIKDETTSTFSNNYDSKYNSYSLAPSYSYFVANNLDVSVMVGYSHGSSNSNSESYGSYKSKVTSFSTGLALRKYFLYEGKIGIRTGPYAVYQSLDIKTEQPTYNNNRSDDVLEGGINADLVYYPIPKLGLSAGLGGINYRHYKSGGDTKVSSNSFNLSFTNSVNFSVYYTFGN